MEWWRRPVPARNRDWFGTALSGRIRQARCMGLFGTNAPTVVERGRRRRADLVGIRYEYTGDDVPRRRESYALRFDDGTVAGVAQAFVPLPWVRLGMSVSVHELDGKVVIDSAATAAAFGQSATTQLEGWKALKSPPEVGISDEVVAKATRKGTPGTFTVNALVQREVMWGLASAIDMEGVVAMPGEEPYAVTVAKIEVPPYATHLPVAGAQLVCVVGRRLDKPVIDWARSAELRPGVGEPPVALEPPAPATPVASSAPPTPIPDQIAHAAQRGDTIGGISLDTYVAIQAGLQRDRVPPAGYDAYAAQYGVAPGAWHSVEADWNAAIRADWRLGAAFGEALSARQRELKRRR